MNNNSNNGCLLYAGLFVIFLFFVKYPSLWIFWFLVAYLYKKSFDSKNKVQKNSLGQRQVNNSGLFTVTVSSGNSYYGNRQQFTGKFYGKADSVELFGQTIKRPFVYVEDKECQGYPFLISKKLPVSFSNGNEANLGYWPSYSEISEEDRGSFIRWMASGKEEDVNIGFVFIYFYGLEYRVFFEEKDLKDILFELIRLFDIYQKKSNSFKSYCSKFIIYLLFKLDTFSVEETKILLRFVNNLDGYETDRLSLLLKLEGNVNVDHEDVIKLLSDALGRFSAKLNGVDMLESSFLKAVKDIPIDKLYSIDEKFSYHYHQASMLRTDNSNVIHKAVVASKQAKNIWSSYQEKLKPYIRNARGRKFNGSFGNYNPVERYSYLPQELKNDFGHPKKDKLEKLLDKTTYKIESVSSLIKKFNLSCGDKITLRQSKLLADYYEAAGYLLEPDARIQNNSYSLDTKLVIFKPTMKIETSTSYIVPSLLFDLGFKMALIDERVLEEETAYILKFLKETFKLSPIEEDRLAYRLILSKKEGVITTAGLISKITSQLKKTDTEMIAKYLIAVAAADKLIELRELNLLKLCFKQLSLSEDSLEKMLFELQATNDPILIKAEKVQPRQGSKIPKNPEKAITEVHIKLDKNKIADILKDTSSVKETLAKVFVDEVTSEEVIAEQRSMEIQDEESIDYNELDSKHLEFLGCLLEKNKVHKKELTALAKNMGLMVNSAIDCINEWTDEVHGDFLLEEDDDMFVLNKKIAALVKRK